MGVSLLLNMSKMPWTGKPLVVLVGPTAVGKTDLAIHLAQALGGEIINADSRQIYRLMDIGTAKPTPAQQQAVPHHLIDLVFPDQTLSLAHIQPLAYQTIDVLHEHGVLPFLVGGTGQYITAIAEGWSIPQVPPDESRRQELESYSQQHGAQALHARLADVDPAAAASIDFRNVRRVIRALEICLTTGRRMSDIQRKQPPPYRILHLGLTLERANLYAQADRRVLQMMDAGFVQEVQALLARGYPPSLPAMSGLGYAEIVRFLQGQLTLEQAITDTQHATHDFIRRQYTWFNGHNPGIMWHNSHTVSHLELIEQLSSWLHLER